ncbi:MAG: ABC-2 transporter permease, partial [Holdemania massiliensis]
FQFQIATGLLSTLVACILDIAIIPLIYKFGAEKSRILLMGAMALIFVLGFGVLRVLPALSIDTEAISFTALALGLIVVFAAAFLISWFCSVKIVEKKEY